MNKVLLRAEAVEWHYDGLKGKVIQWTHANGSDHHDPSVLAWLVGRDGKVVARCPGGKAYNASGLSGWLEEELKKYEKLHPRTAVPLVAAELNEEGKCAALTEAVEAKKPVLIYCGRESGTKKQKKEITACRKFEKGTLGSKKAATAAKGWVMLRLDLSDKKHAELAKTLGVTAAPALLLWEPGKDAPTNLGTKVRGPNLAYYLKKFSAASAK
jgi:hypothetical protein